MNEIEQIIIEKFVPIKLPEIESASLMNRKETKYVLPASLIGNMLLDLSNDYFILEINRKRKFNYLSTYFDSPDYQLFRMHNTNRLSRYKIRYRNYKDTDSTYFEIKEKDNHGRTIKNRMEMEMDNGKNSNLGLKEKSYLKEITSLKVVNLQKVLTIGYERITLINFEKTERVTIDLNLNFQYKNQSENFEKMAIVELKQENVKQSKAKLFLKKAKIRAGGISKYCLGIILFVDQIKHHRFKHRFKKLYLPFKLVS